MFRARIAAVAARARAFATFVVFFAVAVAASAGCGLTGSTSAFVVDVRSAQAKGPISVAAVELAPNQTKLVNVGTYAWGKYGDDDLEVLTQSIRDSAQNLSGASPMRVHLVIRRFLVAHGGSDGIALACVAWALTAPDGALVYHEQFYASRHVNTWGTVGGIKNTVHEAIARRVLGRAATIASQPTTNAYESVRPEHSFDTYEEAIEGLPSSLTAVSVGIVQLGNGYHYVLKQGATDSAQLEWAKQSGHVDWPAKLAAKR